MDVTFLGGSLNTWYLHIIYVMLLFLSAYYGMKLYLFIVEEIKYFDYKKLYRKFVPKKDKSKDIDFKYIERLIKENKL